MNDIWLRVMIAALISSTGAIATYVWSKHNAVSVASNGPEPIARILSSLNDVQRRPAQRLIWQSALRNQELYPGEAVRTAGDAEAKIEFIGEGTTVELDPDTVIEIERTANGINLDFLKGNLFIRSTGTGDKKITLQSGDQKVEVKNSEVVLSKPTTEAQVQVDVVKGDVKVLNKDNTPKVLEQPKLKVLKPLASDPLYKTPDSDERTAIEWASIDSSYVVTLEKGETRTELKAVSEVEPIPGAKGSGEFPFDIGKTYFRLVAKSARPELPQIMSPVMRIEVQAKIPPQLIEPAKGAAVLPSDDKKQVSFQWFNGGRLEDMLLEVARSSDLKEGRQAVQVGERMAHSLAIPGEPGQVFWRVSGRLPGTTQMVSSDVSQFKYGQKPPDPLRAPVLASPADNKTLPLLLSREHGIQLVWTAVKGANRYELTLVEILPESGGKDVVKTVEAAASLDPSAATDAVAASSAGAAFAAEQVADVSPVMKKPEPRIYKREAEGTEMNVKKLPTGKYKWFVVAKDEHGQVSPESQPRHFSIEGVPVLNWADGKTEEKFIYKTAKPFMRVAWERGPGKPVRWRVRFGTDRQPASDSAWAVFPRTQFETPLPEPGIYRVEAEALDESGAVLARTPMRTMEIEQAPPLPAPEFADTMDLEIKSDDHGNVALAWKPVEEAKQYVVSLQTKDGKVVKTMKLAGTKTEFKSLKTGEYDVVLQTIDWLGREGTPGAPRTLKVPEYSDVRAPALKKIDVK